MPAVITATASTIRVRCCFISQSPRSYGQTAAPAASVRIDDVAPTGIVPKLPPPKRGAKALSDGNVSLTTTVTCRAVYAPAPVHSVCVWTHTEHAVAGHEPAEMVCCVQELATPDACMYC